jgi:FkbM family methyltransferase
LDIQNGHLGYRHPVLSMRTVRRVWNDPGNEGHRVRRLSVYVWARSMNRLGRMVVISFGSRSRIEVRPDASSAATVARSPIPDWPEMQAWRRLLTPGDVFVDVGAHLGTYSLWAAEQGARVIAVEPNPPVAVMLRSNLALNQIDAHVCEVAVADKPGVMKMAGRDQLRMALASSGDVEVPVTTLNALVGDEEIAGVKVDVEGAELLVLRGAGKLLGRVPVWQLEWNGLADRDAVAMLLRSHGYELARPDAGGILRPCAGDVGHDVFAVLAHNLQVGR